MLNLLLLSGTSTKYQKNINHRRKLFPAPYATPKLPHRTFSEEIRNTACILYLWLHAQKEEKPLGILLRWLRATGISFWRLYWQGSKSKLLNEVPVTCPQTDCETLTTTALQFSSDINILTPYLGSKAKQKTFSMTAYFETEELEVKDLEALLCLYNVTNRKDNVIYCRLF